MSDKTFLARLRTAFFTGLMLLAPLGVTIIVFVWLVSQVGGTFRNYFFFWVPAVWLGDPKLALIWDILSTAMVVVFITTLGFVSSWVLGRYFGEHAERLIEGIPGIGPFYNGVKQIVQTFGAENRAAFSKAVLVEFPRTGSYAVGFLTNNSGGEASEKTGKDLVSVFVPTTPNPTSGFLVLVPRGEVHELSMNVKDAMKFIISGGAVLPDQTGGDPVPVRQPASPGPVKR